MGAAIVDMSKPALVHLLVDLATQELSHPFRGAPAPPRKDAADNSALLQLFEDSREEHTMLPGSDVEFSTPTMG